MSRIDWPRANRFILIAIGATLIAAAAHSFIGGTRYSVHPVNVVFGIAVAIIFVRRVTRPS